MIGAIAVVTLTLASCGSVSDDRGAGDDRTAAVYETILNWLLDEEIGVDAGERPEWVMFVASRSEQPIDIDVQVAVVAALDPRIFVRFIDDRAEAISADAESQQVRDGGVLIGLGAVPPDGDSIEVYTDRYRDSDDVKAWNMPTRRSGDSWMLAGAPISTDVRPLPTGS
jgi:hypothetical protein